MKRTLGLALAAASLAVAALMAACGGGGGGAAKQAFNRLIVAGDDLADVGVFGKKLTVQNAANPAAGYPLYPEIVGSNLGLPGQCNYFASTGAFIDVRNPVITGLATRPGCTNVAVSSRGVQSMDSELASALNAAGTWSPSDLLLVGAGLTDALQLADGYQSFPQDGTAFGFQAELQSEFEFLLLTQLDSKTLFDTLGKPDGYSLAAGLYMEKLADTYYNAIKSKALDKGATHVAVLNMPDITLTPAQRTAPAVVRAKVQGWIKGFNAQLARRATGDSRVVIVPFYEDLTAQVDTPAAYGLTNVTTPACPRDSVGSIDVTRCLDTTLNANPPAGQGADWWNSWLFADFTHPTPAGHRLLAATVTRALQRAGWL